VLVGVVVACLMMEVATRVLVRMDTGSSFEFRIPHPVLGWTLEPGASYNNRIPEAEVFVAYNSNGWRDVEHERAKPEGVEHYLVLGDSFMEAYSVQLDESFHRQVETLARSRGAEVEAINMGVGGYGTLQAYLTYDREGRLYEPDVVLLGFYMANDLRNNSRELESALGQKELKVTSRPFLDPDSPEWQVTPIDYDGAMRRFERARPRTRGTLHRLGQHSRFVRLLADWADRRTRADDRGDPVDPDRRRLALSGVHDCVQHPAYDRSWKLTRRILERFKADVERDGARLIVFTVPALHEVQNTADGATVCLHDPPGYLRLASTLDGLDIPLIDLLPVFREQAHRGLFWSSDAHWNREGHALAARMVLAQLEDRSGER